MYCPFIIFENVSFDNICSTTTTNSGDPTLWTCDSQRKYGKMNEIITEHEGRMRALIQISKTGSHIGRSFNDVCEEL